MTNKEFFLKTLEGEMPIFIKIIKAIPKNKMDFTPHEKARTAGRMAHQLASQWAFISGIVKEGAPSWGDYGDKKEVNDPKLLIKQSEKNFAELKKDLEKISDSDWESGAAVLTHPGGKWETKKYEMAWGFLFDAIHHRGQLTTYLRIMGEKVPSVYGGSADERPST